MDKLVMDYYNSTRESWFKKYGKTTLTILSCVMNAVEFVGKELSGADKKKLAMDIMGLVLKDDELKNASRMGSK